ncbi:hypothetical protein HY345_02495 [Candidatus Microgenomates bacterium]|nr:hypothetical protein [Candidatus Microgenomates bacterium]
MRKILLFLLLLFFLVPKEVWAATAEYSVTVGPEETVYTGRNFLPDSSYFTYTYQGKLYGILPNDHSYRTNQPLSSDINYVEALSGMLPGAGQNFDSFGAWLVSAYVDPDGTIHGFYAGEPKANIVGGIYGYWHSSVGYAFSKDGGKTWTKPNYPNNEIIRNADFNIINGNPDVKVVKAADDGKKYLYAYYFQVRGQNNGTRLARSLLSDKGKPGTWKKYYCEEDNCSFSEPGLDGKDSKIGNLAGDPFISYNTYLDKYLATDGSISVIPPDKIGKLNFKVSSDAIHWEILDADFNIENLGVPPLHYGKRYTSIISLDGDSTRSGKSFWLYYILRCEDSCGTNQTVRKLHRRKITLNKNEQATKPGDANGDGKVDGVDYVIWLNHYNQNTDKGVSEGDFNKDDKVDGLDYVIWVNNFE